MSVKGLSGRAERAIAAPPERCYELLADVEHWPDWFSVLSAVELRGDRVQVQAQVLRIPLSFQAEVRRRPPRDVELERVPNEPDDSETLLLRTSVAPDPEGSRVSAEVDARVDVPRLLPVPGGVGDRLAETLLSDLAARVE